MKSLTIEVHEFEFFKQEKRLKLLWKLCDFGWTIEHWRDISTGMVCIRIIQP